MKFMKLAEGLFHKFHMKRPLMLDLLYICCCLFFCLFFFLVFFFFFGFLFFVVVVVVFEAGPKLKALIYVCMLF